MMAYTRFNQDKVWITAQGEELAIKGMEPEHVKNVLALLRRHPETLFAQDIIGRARYEWDPDAHFGGWLDNDPREWLERTPLVRELVRVDIRNERRIAKRYGIPLDAKGRAL